MFGASTPCLGIYTSRSTQPDLFGVQAEFPAEHMTRVWEQLQRAAPGLVEELLRLSEPTPAMLVFLVDEWTAAGKSAADDVAPFVGNFVYQKLVVEVGRASGDFRVSMGEATEQ